MTVRTEQGSADDVLNHLRQRKCEVGVLRLPFSAAPDMDFQALHCEQLFVVAGARSKWTSQRRIGLPDLVDEPWIQSYLEMEPGSPIIEAFRAAGLERPRAIVLSNSVNLRYGLLATGGFLTMFPDSLLRYGPRRAPIRVLPINLPRWHVPTSVVALKDRIFVKRRRRIDQDRRRRVDHPFGCEASAPRLEARSAA